MPRDKELTQQLYIDPFTRLPNRFSLEEAITRMKTPILILVNIDSFKEINNCYGNEVGNKMIIAVGEKLTDMVFEKGFTTFKLAADEYALLIDNHYDSNSLSPVLEALSSEISVHKDNNSRAITETIVAFARKIGIKTIVEFVHSQEVFEVEKAIGVDSSVIPKQYYALILFG